MFIKHSRTWRRYSFYFQFTSTRGYRDIIFLCIILFLQGDAILPDTLLSKMEQPDEKAASVVQKPPIRDLRKLAIDLSGQTENMSPVKVGNGGVAYDLMEVWSTVAPKNNQINRFAAAREKRQKKKELEDKKSKQVGINGFFSSTKITLSL